MVEYGVSISPLFPILAAQLPGYIEAELKLFRLRGRSDPRARAFMWGIARGLTDEQIKGVAQYFSSQPLCKRQRDEQPRARRQRQGNVRKRRAGS